MRSRSAARRDAFVDRRRAQARRTSTQLPRVALEYGHTSCAAAHQRLGLLARQAGQRRDELDLQAERATADRADRRRSRLIEIGALRFELLRRATWPIALPKHAAKPAANSCSGLVPGPPPGRRGRFGMARRHVEATVVGCGRRRRGPCVAVAVAV